MTGKKSFCCLFALAFALIGGVGGARVLAATEAAQPLEITAEKSFEWYQDKKIYIARGRAKAQKGEGTVEADMITAHQRDAKAVGNAAEPSGEQKMGGDIDWIIAEGHVRISDPHQRIYGDHAVYDVDRKKALVTGKSLKYMSQYQVVTARDSLEYDEVSGRATATGNAKGLFQKTATDKRIVEGDVLTAEFTKTPSGQKELSHLYANGHAVVVTRGDICRGDRADYDAKANVAIMTGNVKISHGTTQMRGARAESDFGAGLSRLVREDNQGEKSERVQALVKPKSDQAVSKMDKSEKP